MAVYCRCALFPDSSDSSPLGYWQAHMGIGSDRGRNLRILAIGFLPPPLGGISVSFKVFCDIVSRREGIDLTVVNVSGMNQRGHLLWESVGLIARLWRRIAQTDVVMLHCTTIQVPSLALATLCLCRVIGRPFILRMGAGLDHCELGPILGSVAEFIVRRVDLFLVQTRFLVETCRRRGIARVDWYPTNRPTGPMIDGRNTCRRFVFVGQIRHCKGVEELITAAEQLPDSVTVDAYGPFYDGIDACIFDKRKHTYYKGVLSPDKVATTLSQYDAFILPSKARTEGYPGAILEALSVGLPVISTTVGGIPEIVDERCGMLVAPGDVKALAEAMRRLVDDEAYYEELCRGAREAGNRFSSEYWADWLIVQCDRLSQQGHRTMLSAIISQRYREP